MNNRLKSYLSLLLVAAIWGIAGPVIKATLHYLPPFTFLFYRFLFASVVCLPIFVYQWRKQEIGLVDLPKLFFMGLMSTTINLSLIFFGFERTSAMDGTLISAVTPIFIVIGGVIFFKDQITKTERVGLTVVVFGTLITVIQPLLEGNIFAQKNLVGNLLILAAGIQWTVYVLLAKEDFKRHSPLALTTSASLVGLVTFLPLSLAETQARVSFTPLSLGGVLYMAFFSYILAYFLYNFGVSQIEVSEAAVFSYLQPIFAVPLAVWWLKETVTFPFLLGAAIIILGVSLAEYKRGKKRDPLFRQAESCD